MLVALLLSLTLTSPGSLAERSQLECIPQMRAVGQGDALSCALFDRGLDAGERALEAAWLAAEDVCAAVELRCEQVCGARPGTPGACEGWSVLSRQAWSVPLSCGAVAWAPARAARVEVSRQCGCWCG